MITPMLSSADTALVMVSFSVKLAMAPAISKLPRILGWECKTITATESCSLAPLFAGRGLG